MFKWLFLIFVLVPCIELALLATVGAAMGLPVTLGIIILTGVVGAWLAREQGAGAMRRIQQSLNQGRMPTDELIDGMLIFAAGLLLVTPGFLTDTVGFSLLIPPLRSWMRRAVGTVLKHRFKDRFVVHGDAHWHASGDPGAARRAPDVIDVEGETVEREDEK
jgi:UPF0716 protein FxsA